MTTGKEIYPQQPSFWQRAENWFKDFVGSPSDSSAFRPDFGNNSVYEPPVKFDGTPNFANIPRFGTNIPLYHQVTKKDTNMHDVAANYGALPEELIRINQSKTLPPVGSYIQLRPDAAENSYRAPTSDTATSTGFRQGRSPATVIQQQLIQGGEPDQIPAGVVPQLTMNNGQPLTASILQQSGYILKNGNWIKDPTAAANASATGVSPVTTNVGTGSADFMNTGFMRDNAARNVDFYNQLRWDPKRKKYVKIGTLIREGKLDVRTGKFYANGRNKNGKSKGDGNKPASADPTNREGPQTILDVHLGSG